MKKNISWRSLAVLVALFLHCSTSVSSSTASAEMSRPKSKKISRKTSAAMTLDQVSTASAKESYNSNAFDLLAHAIRPIMAAQDQDSIDPSTVTYSTKQVMAAFESLARAQQTLKALDGISHEAYQRTHTASQVDESVRGRARRSAARASASADGLFACELCEFMEQSSSDRGTTENGRMANDDAEGEGSDLSALEASLEEWKTAVLDGRKVLYNSTREITLDDDSNNAITLNLLILYEPNYRGGAGIYHGGIQDAAAKHQIQGGRFLVLISDSAADNLELTLRLLHKDSVPVSLPADSTEEVAYVHPQLYQAAGQVLERLESLLNQTSTTSPGTTAIHFVGRSLAGGVASIAATILDGKLPMPPKTSTRKRRSQKVKQLDMEEASLLCGYARRRTSAVTLGAPPCISANVHTECITSILYGDDVVCRTTKQSLNRFLKRVRKTCERGKGGLVGRQLSRMTDTLSLAATSLKKQRQATSSTSSSMLCVPGRAFLVRPRRLEDHCSMHEVGQYMKQKREALRAAVLWQLDDVVLSKSLWKHHQLDSYIHGLARVQLRGAGETDEEAVEDEMDADRGLLTQVTTGSEHNFDEGEEQQHGDKDERQVEADDEDEDV
jgi:hypothetical protein